VIPSTIDAWVAPPALPRPLADQALVVSPELALVDDELRAEAVALLPEVQPFQFLELRREVALQPEWFYVEPAVGERPRRTPGFAVAFVAYLASAIVRTAAFDFLVLLCVALVVLVVNLAA
jgi:hypothetical protein